VLRTQLSRLLTAIIAELGDWHLNLKRHALCLLRTLLVAAEEHATEHVLRLLPLLAKLVHALLLQEAEQVEKLRSGTAAAANNFAGSSTAVSESMSKKPQSAVISADTLDQDPFHRNEETSLSYVQVSYRELIFLFATFRLWTVWHFYRVTFTLTC
jgi:hypothetical protein